MAAYSFVISVRIVGEERTSGEVHAAILAAGSEGILTVVGENDEFDIGFSIEAEDEETALWSAICDVSAAMPNAVMSIM